MNGEANLTPSTSQGGFGFMAAIDGRTARLAVVRRVFRNLGAILEEILEREDPRPMWPDHRMLPLRDGSKGKIDARDERRIVTNRIIRK
jgi:hypothetical protein